MPMPNEIRWSRFSAAFVADYVGFEKYRSVKLDEVLKRVGLYGMTERSWAFQSPFDHHWWRLFNRNKCMDRIGTFNCTMNHYAILRTALDRGLDHVLVMEDDVRFIKDDLILSEAIEALPAEFDFAKLEWYPAGCHDRMRKAAAECHGYWMDLHGFSTFGAGCTAYSRRGMEWKVSAIEKSLDFRCELRSIDCYDGFDLIPHEINAFVSVPHLALQGVPKGDRIHCAHKKYDPEIIKYEYDTD